MKISDYITITDYVERMRQIDNLGLEKMVFNHVLWNSNKQKVNKGTYYVINTLNGIYNILINDELLIINERINKKKRIED